MKGKGSFILMMLSVVAIVLYVSIFESVITATDTILDHASIATFTALSTVVSIAPVVLLLSGVFGSSFAFYKGYKGSAGQDPSGLMRMVLGVLMVILFVTLFGTIMTAFAALATAANATYIAFDTVVGIAPTVLFLGGIFAGGATATSGARAYGRRRRTRLSKF